MMTAVHWFRPPAQRVHNLLVRQPALIQWPPIFPIRLLGFQPLHRVEHNACARDTNHAHGFLILHLHLGSLARIRVALELLNTLHSESDCTYTVHG